MKLKRFLSFAVAALAVTSAVSVAPGHAATTAASSAPAPADRPGRERPVKLIWDTDFGGDVDDAGVAAMLNALVDNGEVDVLAMMASNPTRWAAPGIDAINTYYRHGNIPVGSIQPVFDDPGNNNVSGYAELLAKNWRNNIRDGARAPEAVDLYRKVLARQRDHSVVIVVVGGQTNLANLLDSGPDRHSRRSGRELVAQKVSKLVVMGAAFPSGREWNIMLDVPAATHVAEDWPTPIVYSGFEVGDTILTGSALFTETPAENPVRAAYEDYVGFGNDRSSWDQTATYYAIRGGDGLFELSERGTVVFAEDGSNTWRSAPEGTHRYLRTLRSDDDIAAVIERLMVQPPERGGPRR